MEGKKKTLQEQLDEFYERMGLEVIHPVTAATSEPTVVRKGFRARKGQITESRESMELTKRLYKSNQGV